MLPLSMQTSAARERDRMIVNPAKDTVSDGGRITIC